MQFVQSWLKWFFVEVNLYLTILGVVIQQLNHLTTEHHNTLNCEGANSEIELGFVPKLITGGRDNQ